MFSVFGGIKLNYLWGKKRIFWFYDFGIFGEEKIFVLKSNVIKSCLIKKRGCEIIFDRGKKMNKVRFLLVRNGFSVLDIIRRVMVYWRMIRIWIKSVR